MRGVKGLLLCALSLFSLAVTAADRPVSFAVDQNELCWRLIEQKASGHCKLNFSFDNIKPVTAFPRSDVIGYAVSSFNDARNSYPTTFQKIEYALQFFYFSLERFPVRDSLNYIRSGDGTIQLSMSVRTSRSSGYSFVLADNESQLRQLVANLQNPHAARATNYYRNIEKLFAD
ncbi:MAG: hypothetical protein KKE30_00645 [Gammaproteobacteria bacterium]|nr:hypothetical protein [Gammaproteobacteria bacterium]MBU1556298.1 hypothetical protein [Gammaproteobacteria bacterium]MBU2068882.1 hypothetical protein [Gammaproteobacteria bacterium]MBU2184955.1 hypothetical protein [Gammaproteobacteria bacterium]MBU2204214.1 hypothetical protein [Gammaproteobacteria bacterium]